MTSTDSDALRRAGCGSTRTPPPRLSPQTRKTVPAEPNIHGSSLSSWARYGRHVPAGEPVITSERHQRHDRSRPLTEQHESPASA
jgi:hypothetical protein